MNISKHAPRRVLGVDIGGTSVKMGILDTVAGLVDVRQIDMIVNDPEAIVDKIARLAMTYDPDIVGVGSAGAVNHKTGLVSAGNLKWHDVPLRAMMEARLGKPVWVDNDANAALMAEWHSGVCKGASCAVCVTIGTGIGGGLLIDGRPWRGDDNTAFELGHIVTHGDAYANTNAKEGHLEYYASGMGLSRNTGGRPARDVVVGVIAGDAGAMAIFDILIRELSIGLCTVIMLFRPEVIALGGGISAAGSYLLDGIRNKVAEFRGGRGRINDYDVERIKLAVHGNNAGMIGAAALAEMFL